MRAGPTSRAQMMHLRPTCSICLLWPWWRESFCQARIRPLRALLPPTFSKKLGSYLFLLLYRLLEQQEASYSAMGRRSASACGWRQMTDAALAVKPHEWVRKLRPLPGLLVIFTRPNTRAAYPAHCTDVRRERVDYPRAHRVPLEAEHL
jgi:hypothetical protein